MKTTLAIMAGLLLAVPARADSLTILWNTVNGATSYLVQQSTDGGTTWQTVTEVSVPTAAINIQGDKLVLLRLCSKNATAVACRMESGWFYNGLWNTRPNKITME